MRWWLVIALVAIIGIVDVLIVVNQIVTNQPVLVP